MQGISLNRNQIKYIAIFAMLLDHIAIGFLPANSPVGVAMRFVGRITGPVMCAFIAEGFRYSRDINKYILRLCLFALLSWAPFVYFAKGLLPIIWNGTKWSVVPATGVIYTLLLGLCSIRVYEARDRYGFLHPLWLRGGLLFLILYLSQYGDWSYYGVSMCLIFHIFRDFPGKMWSCYGVIVFFCMLDKYFSSMSKGNLWWVNLSEIGMLLVPILLGMLYNGQAGKNTFFNKWFFYVFYPAHLILLGLIRWK